MSDQASTDLREEVRSKYAAAARAVLEPEAGVTASCRGSSADKPAVLTEMFRVLVPGGRIGISDVVAEDHLSPADRAAAGSYVGCIAGALPWPASAASSMWRGRSARGSERRTGSPHPPP